MNISWLCVGLVVGSYLAGSLSSAILVTRLWSGKDLHALGNHQISVVNVTRSVGLFPAVMVGAMDLLKGALPVLGAQFLGLGYACALSGAISAVVGHSYPLYFHFRGGKGLAVSIGALLIFTPTETLLVLPVMGLVYMAITGSLVSGTLVSFALLVGLNVWRGYPWIVSLAPLALLLTMGICSIPQTLLEWKARSDKKRLIAQWLSPKDVPQKEQSRVAVITDSVASLPAEWCQRENIHVVPMALILPEGTYRDGVDIDPREYFQRLRRDGFTPKTSAPSPGEFLDMYQQLSKAHRSGVVITPPRELTQTWEAARLGAQMAAEYFQAEIVDSRTAGPAQGFVALAAVRATASGADLPQVLEAIQQAQERVGFIGVLDTVKFLVEGGRVAHLNRWLGSALRLYPILYIHQGQIRLLGMARTKGKAIERMLAWLKDNLHPEGLSIAIAHTDAFEEAEALKEQILAQFRPMEYFVTELTPVIGAHAGPGLLGVAWWIHAPGRRKEKDVKAEI